MSLLACNDIRIAQYPLILKNAKEAQAKAEAKAEEQQRKTTEAKMEDVKREYSTKVRENAASIIINRCINTNSDTSCDNQFRSLQRNCQNATSPYNYCKDEQSLLAILSNTIFRIQPSHLSIEYQLQ